MEIPPCYPRALSQGISSVTRYVIYTFNTPWLIN